MSAVATLITDHLGIWSSAIKAKSSAGRGGSKKQEFYGIRKLRELILELAVRGLLVPQDSDDEPASECMKRIANDRAALIKAGKLKKTKHPPVDPAECPHDIPSAWQWVRFGEIALHNAGKTLDQGRNSGELRDYITTSNLYWGRFDLTDVRQMAIRGEELEKCTATWGDLLLCEGGEAGRAAVWTEQRDICFQNHIHRARLLGGIDPFYAYRFFEKLSMSGEIENYRKGVGISNMSGKALASIAFPLPPLAEQHRIVAKIDELIGLCDQLELQQETSVCTHGSLVEALLSALTSASDRGAFDQAWQRIAAHFDTLFTTETSIDQLRKTILQLAVMGKLVKQDPKDEPATELLKRIASERAKLVKQGRIKKQKPLMPVSDFEAPFDLPTGWEWSRIGEAALSTDYGLSDKTFEANHGVPVLAMGHIQSGEVLLGSHKRIPETVDSLPELYLDDRDLLYNRTNSADLVGKTGIFRGPSNQFTFASYLIRIRTLKDSALPEMINLNMLAPFFRLTQIDPNLKQQCGQANVNGTVMKNMLVAIPPAGEMSRIVAKVDELMSHCARLKESIQAAQTTQLLLADSLVNVAIH